VYPAPVPEASAQHTEKQKPYIVTFANAYGNSGQLDILRSTLRALLRKTDLLDTESGRLSLCGFMTCLKEECFQKTMSEFGVQPHRAGLAFKLMDKQGTGEISIDEFVEGMVNFKMHSNESGSELDMKTLNDMIVERELAARGRQKAAKKDAKRARTFPALDLASKSRFDVMKQFCTAGQANKPKLSTKGSAIKKRVSIEDF
jgi:hypothetical protein